MFRSEDVFFGFQLARIVADVCQLLAPVRHSVSTLVRNSFCDGFIVDAQLRLVERFLFLSEPLLV